MSPWEQTRSQGDRLEAWGAYRQWRASWHYAISSRNSGMYGRGEACDLEGLAHVGEAQLFGGGGGDEVLKFELASVGVLTC